MVSKGLRPLADPGQKPWPSFFITDQSRRRLDTPPDQFRHISTRFCDPTHEGGRNAVHDGVGDAGGVCGVRLCRGALRLRLQPGRGARLLRRSGIRSAAAVARRAPPRDSGPGLSDARRGVARARLRGSRPIQSLFTRRRSTGIPTRRDTGHGRGRAGTTGTAATTRRAGRCNTIPTARGHGGSRSAAARTKTRPGVGSSKSTPGLGVTPRRPFSAPATPSPAWLACRST